MSSFTVLFFSLSFVGAFPFLNNCIEAEKLIYWYISQEDSTLFNSFHPESYPDTLHSKEVVVLHSIQGDVRKKNEGEGSSPL